MTSALRPQSPDLTQSQRQHHPCPAHTLPFPPTPCSIFFFKIKAFTQPSDGKCHASFPTVILISLDLLETWDNYSFRMP